MKWFAIVLAAMGLACCDDASTSPSPKSGQIGSSVRLASDLDLTIERVITVYDDGLGEPGSRALIGVLYQTRNDSASPVENFNRPRIVLVNSEGVKYSPDFGAARQLQEMGLQREVLASGNSLNPGLSDNLLRAFVVESSRWKEAGWTLQTDQNDVLIPVPEDLKVMGQ